jgi:hypothetical protein
METEYAAGMYMDIVRKPPKLFTCTTKKKDLSASLNILGLYATAYSLKSLRMLGLLISNSMEIWPTMERDIKDFVMWRIDSLPDFCLE